MATRVTSELVGIKEDVINKLFNVAPHRHAFMNSLKKGSCSAELVQWETDTDRAAVTTAAVDFTLPTEGSYLSSAPTLLSNRVERLETFVAVSDKSMSMDTYGNSSAFNYQVTKGVKSIKDGMETNMVGTAQAAVSSSGVTTAARAANFLHYVTTNAVAASATVAGDVISTLVIGDIDELMEKIWKVSSVEGNYNLLVSPKNKRVISGLLDGATNVRRDLGYSGMKINTAFSGYMGDFGDVAIMPSQFISDTVAFLYNPSMFEHTTLKGFSPKITKLAKDGRRVRAVIDTAYTLKSFNELASGVITAISDS